MAPENAERLHHVASGEKRIVRADCRVIKDVACSSVGKDWATRKTGTAVHVAHDARSSVASRLSNIGAHDGYVAEPQRWLVGLGTLIVNKTTHHEDVVARADWIGARCLLIKKHIPREEHDAVHVGLPR